MQTSLNRALNKHVFSIIPAHISTPFALPLAKPFVPCAPHLLISTELEEGSWYNTKVLNIQFLGWIWPAEKFYLALSNCMNPYTQLWQAQERSIETQDTMSTQNHAEVPNSVQDSQMLKDPTQGASGKVPGLRQGQSISQGFWSKFEPWQKCVRNRKSIDPTVLSRKCRMEEIPAWEAIR